uniref:Uncharacterized protein n=1 Tax=Caenorhabditis japonica TaxID=281687 RepID=A0A8R1HSI4_CAEJA
MGLIDDAKGRLAAEKEHNNPTNTKAPVKFDEVVDFIDDGAEDIADEKAPVVFVKKVNITSPVRGNPVVNLDELNGNVVGNGLLRKDSDEENHVVQTANDPYSQMELGNAPTHYYQNLMGLFSSRKTDGNYPIINSAPEVVQPAVDDVDLDKLERSQKNFSCDEQEQIEYQNLRDTREVPKIRNVLGPVSEGFFASFGGNPSHVLGCDLSVINPVSVANANVFQTLTSNGRLLPAIPRRYFPPNELPLHPRPRPGIKSPVTIMLNHPVHHNNSISDSIIPQFGGSPMSVSPTPSLSPPKSPPPPPPLQDKDNQVVSASTKKRNKKKAKKAAAVSDVITEETVKENEIDEETAPAPVEINSSVEGEEKEDGENENDDGMTEEEREARRLRNRKDRLKKKQKKEKMEMEMKALDVVAQQREQSELVDNDFNRNQKEISPVNRSIFQVFLIKNEFTYLF